MSACLLQNSGMFHVLKDDLESFLHMLSWTTLCYMPAIDSHTSDDRAKDLKKFDEYDVYQGGADHGGLGKRDSLGARTYPSQTFQPRDHTPIFRLIRTLRNPFRSLYVEPPTVEDRVKINDPETEDDDTIKDLSAEISRYDRETAQLQSPAFFISQVQVALDKNDWPTNDKADGSLPISSLAGDTAKQKQTKESQLQQTRNQWESSRELSGSSKRGASPAPESSNSKRRRTGAHDSQTMA